MGNRVWSPGFPLLQIKPCSHIARNLGYRILMNLLLGHRCFQSSGIQRFYVHIILRDVFSAMELHSIIGIIWNRSCPRSIRRALCHRMLSGGIETQCLSKRILQIKWDEFPRVNPFGHSGRQFWKWVSHQKNTSSREYPAPSILLRGFFPQISCEVREFLIEKGYSLEVLCKCSALNSDLSRRKSGCQMFKKCVCIILYIYMYS